MNRGRRLDFNFCSVYAVEVCYFQWNFGKQAAFQSLLPLSRLSAVTRGTVHFGKPKFLSLVFPCQRPLPMVWDKPQHCTAGTFARPNWPVCLARESNQCVYVFLCISLQASSCCISRKWWGSTYLCWQRARTTTPWRLLLGPCKTSALDSGLWVRGLGGHDTQALCSVWIIWLLATWPFNNTYLEYDLSKESLMGLRKHELPSERLLVTGTRCRCSVFANQLMLDLHQTTI